MGWFRGGRTAVLCTRTTGMPISTAIWIGGWSRLAARRLVVLSVRLAGRSAGRSETSGADDERAWV